MNITTKFNMEEVVWIAGHGTTEIREVCQDCLGSCVWTVSTKGGSEFEIKCETCRYGYEHRGFVSQHKYSAKVWSGVVGQIRAKVGDPDGNEYMLHETGIGSGSIWPEHRLFKTREEAVVAAQAEVEKNDAKAIKDAVEQRARGKRDSIRSEILCDVCHGTGRVPRRKKTIIPPIAPTEQETLPSHDSPATERESKAITAATNGE